MVTAAVTRPEWDKNGNLVRSGKVGVYRCWDEATRKQNRYEYTIDPTTNEKLRVGTRYEKGDTFMKDKNVDAEFHHKLMTTKSMPHIRAHYGTKKLKFDVALQQDGAGGHGTKGSWSYKIEQDAEKGKPQIFFHTQPANSPILNASDLGLWPMITTTVVADAPKTVVGFHSEKLLGHPRGLAG
jgi:hypothetical protein